MKLNSPLLIAISICLGILILFFLSDYFFSGAIWQQMLQSQSGITGEYCEFDNKNHFIRQHSNTYSNIFYALVGILLMFHSKKTLFPILFNYLGIVFIYLCFGSAFFHASLTFLGQRIDMNGTYGLNLNLLVIAIAHFKPSLHTKQKEIMGGLILSQTLLFFLSPYLNSSIIIPLSILLISLLQLTLYFLRRNFYYGFLILLSLFTVILAIKIRADDVAKIHCNPMSVWQGHALWHLFTALSAGLSATFFIYQKKNLNFTE